LENKHTGDTIGSVVGVVFFYVVSVVLFCPTHEGVDVIGLSSVVLGF
jgi:hypothetical protein